jgi:predicted hotdog family 3-hydroxylacyl-ACP dehydratase
MITEENIQSFIPQKPPFVMVDHLLFVNETVTRTGFSVKADNIFLQKGEFKEPGLVENIAQTAAARAGYISKRENKPVLVGYIGAVNSLQVYSLPKTGDELITEITVENQIFDVTLISGKIICNEKTIAECKMKIFINQIKYS